MTDVTVSLGFTKNMGDFESLRLDVGITDTLHSGEKVDQGLHRVKAKIEEEFLDYLAQVEKDIVAMREQIRNTGDYKRKVAKAAEAK